MQKPLLSFQEEKLHAPEISIEEKLNGRCKKEEEGGETWTNELAATYGNILTQVNLAQKYLHFFFQIYCISLFFLCPKHTHGLGATVAGHWRRLQSLFVHAMTTLAQVGIEIAIFKGFFKPFPQFPSNIFIKWLYYSIYILNFEGNRRMSCPGCLGVCVRNNNIDVCDRYPEKGKRRGRGRGRSLVSCH